MTSANELTTANETPSDLHKTGRSSRTYTKLVEQYKRIAEKSAENIINIAETLVRASSKLSTDDFNRFCNEVRLQKDGSTFRKLMAIGKKISRFEPFLGDLPSGWTTLYRLASISDDRFKLVTEDSRFSRSMTAKDVTLIVGSVSKARTVQQRDVIIDLSGLDTQKQLEVYQELQLLEKRFGFQLTPCKSLRTKAVNPSPANENVPNGTSEMTEAV
jgi:hypothetical protein